MPVRHTENEDAICEFSQLIIMLSPSTLILIVLANHCISWGGTIPATLCPFIFIFHLVEPIPVPDHSYPKFFVYFIDAVFFLLLWFPGTTRCDTEPPNAQFVQCTCEAPCSNSGHLAFRKLQFGDSCPPSRRSGTGR